jgi:hypothetical protein
MMRSFSCVSQTVTPSATGLGGAPGASVAGFSGIVRTAPQAGHFPDLPANSSFTLKLF